MSKEGRRVFQFEPGQGFTQVDEGSAPVIEKNPEEVVPVQNPEVEIPKPEKVDTPQPDEQIKDENPPQPEVDGEDETPDNEVELPDEDEGGDIIDESGSVEGEDSIGEESEREEDDTPEQGVDQPTDVPQTDDFFVAAATRLKSSGYLPEDFELDEGLTEDQADLKIYEAYVEKLKPEANKELLSEFQKEMQKKGWTEKTLEFGSMLENGVSQNDITQIQDYSTLASVDTSKMSEEDKDVYIRQMYRDRGWKEAEIKRTLSAAELDGEIDTLVSEASQYFDNRKEEVKQDKMRIAQQNAQQKQKIEQYRQAVISHVFNNKELGGETLTDEQLDTFEEALYERTIPVQHEGQVYQVSPYEQFQAALNSDFGLQLWAFKKWLFREQEAQQYMAQAQKAAEESQIVKWGKRTKKVKKEETQNTKTQQTKPTAKTSTTGGDTYIMENGQIKRVTSK